MNTHNTYRQICKTKKTNLFTQICVVENLTLPENLPDIEQIVSCVIDPQVLSLKAINTMKGLSYEGQFLTGKKVVIELRLKQKILYVAEYQSQSVHVIENEFYQSAYIVIPCKFEGTDPEYLIKNKYLKPEITIEDIFYSQTSKRNIFKNICFLLKLVFVPTFEICYSIHEDCKSSNLVMIYEDGANTTQISNELLSNNIKPKWSPNGNEIAFLSNRDDRWMLYLYSLRTCVVKRITDLTSFKSVTGFCWTPDGKNLCFTVYDNGTKEIYITPVSNTYYKQLTFGETLYSSYSPKCSPDGTKIGFIRSVSNIADLWIMNIDGTNCRQVTFCGNIKSFDWSSDSKDMVFIFNQELLYIIDTVNYDYKPLISCDDISQMRKVLYSPDSNYLAFIGSDINSDNIYLYDFKQSTLQNITGHSSMKISDLTWKIDSTKIYYAANELFHFNINSVTINDCTKTQLTFTTATDIELDYRPQVF